MSEQAVNTVYSTLFKNIFYIPVIKEHDTAQLPAQATEGSAGLDLSSFNTDIIKPHSKLSFSTGIKMQLPK